jgi:hypothetical protein
MADAQRLKNAVYRATEPSADDEGDPTAMVEINLILQVLAPTKTHGGTPHTCTGHVRKCWCAGACSPRILRIPGAGGPGLGAGDMSSRWQKLVLWHELLVFWHQLRHRCGHGWWRENSLLTRCREIVC